MNWSIAVRSPARAGTRPASETEYVVPGGVWVRSQSAAPARAVCLQLAYFAPKLATAGRSESPDSTSSEVSTATPAAWALRGPNRALPAAATASPASSASWGHTGMKKRAKALALSSVRSDPSR